jgi:hypothetical protein
MKVNFELSFQTEPCHGESISAARVTTFKKMTVNRLVWTRMPLV